MSEQFLTARIDGQQIEFEFHGPEGSDPPEPLKAALANPDWLQPALQVSASLTHRSETAVELDLDKLQAWLGRNGFDVSATEILNELLAQNGVQITEFAIPPSGKFTIALKVAWQNPLTDEQLSPEIRQIIQGPEVGLGLSRIL